MRVSTSSKQQISLRKLLPEAEFLGADDIFVAACCSAARKAEPGSLFAAIDRPEDDGLEHAIDAVARGCSAVLSQRALPGVCSPVCIVPDVREAYGRLCQALAGNPSRQTKVIAVAGASGKSTTACLIASILHTAGHGLGIMSTLGYSDGSKIVSGSATTPPPEILARWLSRMVANGCSHAVVEVSDEGLNESRIAGIEFDAVCATSVNRPSATGGVRRAEASLLDRLTPEGFAVLSADDPGAADLLGRVGGPVLTVAMHAAAEVTARVFERLPSEQTFLLTAGGETIPVCTRMIGDHHVYNCLVAAAVGLAYGIDLPTVARGLEAADHVPGRLERIECGQPFSVYIDNSTTPDRVATALETIREVVRGRLICVFGGSGDDDPNQWTQLGAVIDAGSDVAVLTNDAQRKKAGGSAIQDILGGFRSAETVEVIPHRSEAIAWALSQAQPGDALLIAGQGDETKRKHTAKRARHDDGEIARRWLYTNQSV